MSFQELQQDVFNVVPENKKLILRDYQEQAINNLRKSIASGHKRIILQQEVGSGKTVAASEIMRLASEKQRKTLFLAPRRQLIYQTYETLKGFGINCGMIMSGERAFHQPFAQVGSVDTITTRLRNGTMDLPEADTVIVDEAHAMFSKNRLELFDRYPFVIALSATPCLANGKGMGGFYTDLILGPSTQELIDGGNLVPMKYFGADAPDLEAVGLNSDGDYIESQLAEASDKPELIGSIYRNYKRIAGDRPTAIFAVNRKHAQSIYDEFLSHGIKCDYIDAFTTTEERDAIKHRMEKGITKVVINILVMAFGTNWPFISCVIVARVTRNIAAWRQMLGRGSRPHELSGKIDCYVIYHGKNFDDLGRLEDEIEWSLDDKETVRERREAKKKKENEPKEQKCPECNTMFKGRRTCPACGFQHIKEGEQIPYHEADLVELKSNPKPTPVDKSQFYAELLGYAMKHKKSTSFALAIFRDKFKEWPYNKNSIKPIEPSKETIGYIKHARIKWVKGKGSKAA
jgi:DNA repair protein RadD